MRYPIGTRFQYKEDDLIPKQWRIIISPTHYKNESTGTRWEIELVNKHNVINIIWPKEATFDSLYLRLKS